MIRSSFLACSRSLSVVGRSSVVGGNSALRRFSTANAEEPTEFPTEKFDKYRIEGVGDSTKRAFTYAVTGAVFAGLATSVKSILVDFVDTMSASADVLAMANVEVDLSAIPLGTNFTVKWRGKPLFVRHRTPAEIDAARSVPVATLVDKQSDEERTKKEEWLVLIGVCTHLGCVPMANAGDYSGYFCPCHGSHYDTSGRIRKGPAPLNLEVPPYRFESDSLLLVGED